MPELKGNDGLLARFASLAYNTDEERAAGAVRGWRYLPDLSTHQVAVFRQAHKAVIAFRGTEFNKGFGKARADFVSDMNYVIARLPNTDYSAKLKVAQTAMRRLHLEPSQVQVTGHSLGGTTAMDVAKKLGLKGAVFNPGRFFTQGAMPAGVKLIREEADPISMLPPALGIRSKQPTKVKTTRNVRAKLSLKAHGMENFLSERFAKQFA